MFSAPDNAVVAGSQALIVATGLFVLGYLLTSALPWTRGLPVYARFGLAVPAVVLASFALMLLHILTGGAVYSNAWLVRGVAAALAFLAGVAALRSTARAQERDRASVVAAGGVVLAAVAAWCLPLFATMPPPHKGDTDLHLGWAEQVMSGAPLPTAGIIGDVPNYYPWLFHALVSFVARFTPGGRAMHALAPLQVLLVVGAMLGLFAVGRAAGRRWQHGAGAAFFGALAGGFGYMLVDGVDLVLYTRRPVQGFLRYGGDLVFERPYNSAFFNLIPPFPRDVSIVLLLGATLLLVVASSRRGVGWLAGGGIAVGLTGLAGAETFFVGMLLVVAVAVVQFAGRRPVAVAAAALPAVAIHSLWLVPLSINYVRLGGFADLGVGLVALPPLNVLIAWGVTTPFAICGAIVLARLWKSDPVARVVLLLPGAALAAVAASSLAGRFLGPAFRTIGYQHRYWPLVYVGAAVLGGIGAGWLARRLAARSTALAVGAAVAVVGLGIPSPLIASAALPRRLPMPPVLEASLRGDGGTVLNVLAAQGQGCRAAVPPRLSRKVFSYTGHTLVYYAFWRERSPDPAHVRWKGIYERMPGPRQRLRDNEAVLEGDPGRFEDVVERYGVDVIVTSPEAARNGVLTRHENAIATWGARQYAVVRVDDCDTD